MDALTDLFIKLLVLSLLTEALTERLKELLPVKIPSWMISSVIATAAAIYWQVDVTFALNNQIDLAGSILTGFLASRGSNWVNDIASKLQQLKQPKHSPGGGK